MGSQLSLVEDNANYNMEIIKGLNMPVIKRKNFQDATLINIRALKKQLAELKRRVKALEARFNS